jgi:ribosomal protein S18 acetylase RimI-like enzyme
MSSAGVRRAEVGDAADVARLLDEFNRAYGEPTPGVEVLAERAARMIAGGEIVVFLAGEGPDGIAQLQFRASIWAEAPDAYLAELYVAPGKRRRGLGRALLEAAMEAARATGAEVIDLNTSEDDVEAISLYESAGFTNREGGPDGPRMRYYEREL